MIRKTKSHRKLINIRRPDYNVIIAQIEDLTRITEILNQAIEWGNANAYTEVFNTGDRIEWFYEHADGKYAIFVVKENNNVVGYLNIDPYRKGRQAFKYTAEVSYYVDFNHHRKGIASALMNHAFDHCINNKIKNLVAFLYGHNESSIIFLKKFGFKQWGLLPGAASIVENDFDHVVYGKKIN